MLLHTFPSALQFSGPYSICDDPEELRSLGNDSAVYLWCIETSDGSFLVHYIGETNNVGSRTTVHYKNQLSGKLHAFCPDNLRKNLSVLAHRAGVGSVGVFKGRAPDEVNSRYIRSLSLFFATLPNEYSRSDRCQFETALAYAVEDFGQNILYVSHLHKPREQTRPISIETGEYEIVALSNQIVCVGVA